MTKSKDLPLFPKSLKEENIKIINLRLYKNSYNIFVGNNILEKIGLLWRELNLDKKVLIVTNPHIERLFGETIKASIAHFGLAQTEIVRIPIGEQYKSLEMLNRLYDVMINFGLERNSTVVAIGGGVIGDLAGFAAATFMRGINLIHVPTTLVAQVDSAIGGKTGVNHPRAKNIIGSFYQPTCVFADINTLTTLPERELRCGFAEIIKYGVIEDKFLFEFLDKNKRFFAFHSALQNQKKAFLVFLTKVVICCIAIKAKIVSKDEKEKTGLRMKLNFGHTIGHAIEALTNYRIYNHGEAVALGMIAAAKISLKLKLIDEKSVNKVLNLIKLIGLPSFIHNLRSENIINALKLDKKVFDGKIRFVLPIKIGKVIIRDDVPLEVVDGVLREMII
jgi:3-dehydroquinate synthase